MSDWLGALLLGGYIFTLLALAESLRRRLGLDASLTRKVIHIGVGMSSWTLHGLFDRPHFFLLGCVFFGLLTFLDWKYGFVASMSSSDATNLGTVYFPLAAGAVALLLWETPPLMVAALMPLTWGDGVAPVVGQRYGRHPYTVAGHQRTLEGSFGFFAAALLFTWLALWLIPGSPTVTARAALLPALLVALTTAITEAVSIRGLDNLLVTAVAVVIFTLWPFS